MSATSLREIEKALTTLWMRRDKREAFLQGEACGIDAQLVQQIDKEGVELYAMMLNFGHQEVLSSIYPFCARLLGTEWQGTVDDFLEKFPPNHFNFNRIADRFPLYLEEHGKRFRKRFPFLIELADYEWVELLVLEMEGDPPKSELDALTSPDQFAQFGPILNPALMVREYRYPIIKIAEQLESSKRLPRNVHESATIVATYRDPQSNRCRFLNVGATAASVLEQARSGKTYTELVQLAVSLTPQSDPQNTVAEFLSLIEDLQENRLFLGNRKLV